MQSPILSEKLLASVSRDFFRPLTRPSTAIYVDCAERLAEIAGEAGRIPHGEAIALIREVLAAHPDIVLEDDEGASLRDARQRAGQIFNRLCDAKWLEDQQLGLHERWALVSPGLRPLLRLLRELAEDEIAELRTFADTVRGVCETLERPGILDARIQEPDALRATVTDVNARLEMSFSTAANASVIHRPKRSACCMRNSAPASTWSATMPFVETACCPGSRSSARRSPTAATTPS